jgi:hypothetical protein
MHPSIKKVDHDIFPGSKGFGRYPPLMELYGKGCKPARIHDWLS